VPVVAHRLPAELHGLRVLVVEDELLVFLQIEDALPDCTIIGPARSPAEALALIERDNPQAALLDVNLSGERVTPVAEHLRSMHVPFVLVTGYGQRDLPEPVLAAAPRIGKPFRSADIVQALASAVEPAALPQPDLFGHSVRS
jgi:CheY-like chemotaxis protein